MNYFAVPGIRNEYRSEFLPLIDADKILDVVCGHFGITRNILLKHNRIKKFVYARYIVCLFLKKYTSNTSTSIANLLQRDHTTVLYGLKTINNWIETESNIKDEVGLIQIKIFEA
jgi:chromosomal replication initiator protein